MMTASPSTRKGSLLPKSLKKSAYSGIRRICSWRFCQTRSVSRSKSASGTLHKQTRLRVSKAVMVYREQSLKTKRECGAPGMRKKQGGKSSQTSESHAHQAWVHWGSCCRHQNCPPKPMWYLYLSEYYNWSLRRWHLTPRSRERSCEVARRPLMLQIQTVGFEQWLTHQRRYLGRLFHILSVRPQHGSGQYSVLQKNWAKKHVLLSIIFQHVVWLYQYQKMTRTSNFETVSWSECSCAQQWTEVLLNWRTWVDAT